MNTITLNDNTLEYAEMYAKRHNISVADTIEKGVLLLLDNFQINQDVTKTAEFQDALTYVKTLKVLPQFS